MLQYQDTVNQDLSERSQARGDWENIEQIDALLRERYMSYPTNFSRNLLTDLRYSSDRFAKCAGTAPKSGVFYVPNATQQPIKNEEFVDLNQLLYCNSDESSVPALEIEDDVDLNNYFDHRKGANNNQFTYNKSNSNNNTSSSSNCKNEYTKLGYVKSGSQSTSSSVSQSPTNVLNMGSPQEEFYLLNATDMSAENTTIDGNFFSDPIYENLCDDKLFYTPDHSCGPLIDFSDGQKRKQPTLTLNLKGTFVNEDEINTPNIINTIMEASDDPPLFIRAKEELFSEVPFFPTSPQHFESYPFISSPATVTDTVDLSAVTQQPVPLPAKKPGRSRKRRHYDSDEEGSDDDDDDETYVPPLRVRKKSRDSRTIGKKKIVYEDISEDEDYIPPRNIKVENVENRLKAIDAIEDELLRVGKRGRPPKHAKSISSDDYSLLDPDEAKYREMRDRNNEASRKSRYKRKRKEMLMTDELDELETENVKLKTQVEELQKTVERYRDNLMKVMMGKK